MRLPDFDYHAPDTLTSACELLKNFGNSAKIIAGGTDLLISLKENPSSQVQQLVSLKNIPGLAQITFDKKKGLQIGATVTINQICCSDIIRRLYPGLYDAALSMCAYQLRNQATIGGNLCEAVPSADIPPILMAMNARITLVSSAGKRELALDDFFVGPRKTVLKPSEILTCIDVPLPQPDNGSCYLKYGHRETLAIAVAGVAVALILENGSCKSARVALGAVAPTPLLVKEAADVLIGNHLTEDTISNAAKIAGKASRPITDMRGSEWYRRDLVEVLTRRAILKSVERAKNGKGR